MVKKIIEFVRNRINEEYPTEKILILLRFLVKLWCQVLNIGLLLVPLVQVTWFCECLETIRVDGLNIWRHSPLLW